MSYFNDTYEPDFNEVMHEEAIYYRQILILKRISKLSNQEIINMTANDAGAFINTIRRGKSILSRQWMLNNREAKRGRVAVPQENGSVVFQHVSATILAPNGQTVLIRKSTIVTRT